MAQVATEDEESVDSPAPAGQAIVVTGSRISNPNLELASPVSVVSSEDLELAQTNVAEEFLRELPSAVPSIGSAVNNGNGGASFVNLRGIGSNRNLVLLDGRRFTPADTTGRVDLNNIPLAVIERTEILTGGATTTYGADAIGGVVNFITKRDFEGVEATFSEQITEEGDGNVFRADVTIGANFDDGRGNAVLSLGYQNQDPVFQGDRDFSVFNIGSFTGAGSGSSNAVPAVIIAADGPDADTAGIVGQISDDGQTLGAFDRPFNFNPFNIFLTPFERFNIYGSGRYEVSDAVEVFTQAAFSKNTVSTIIAPGGSFFNTYTFNLNNPFIPDAIAQQFGNNLGLTAAQFAAARNTQFGATLADGSPNPDYVEFDAQVRRRTPEAGSRTSDFTTTLFNLVGGLRGDLTDNIQWEVSGTYGESEQIQRQGGFARFDRLQQSLIAIPDGSGGVVCADTSRGCAPINLFGALGNLGSQEAVDFVFNLTQQVITKASLQQVQGVLNGDLGFGITDTPIAFAAGAEYRKYTASQISDEASQTPGAVVGGGGAAPNIDGEYDVKDVFGELVIPIVEDSFIEDLTLEVGGRYSDYSTAGGEFTWKAGGTFAPVEQLTFRGNYQRSSRTPNIGELFAPVTTFLTNLAVDPCAGSNPVGDAALTAACVSQIVANGATQAQAQSLIGNILQPAAGQINATGGGNPDLGVETATTWTVGAIIEPLYNLSLTVDYWNIKIEDAITSPTVNDIVGGCYDNPSASNPICSQILRSATTGGLDGSPDEVPGLQLASSNLGLIKTDGIDVSLRYRTSLTDNIGFRFATDGTWVNSNTFQATPTSVNRECVSYYSVNCPSIQPEFVFNTRATFSFFDQVDLSVLWRYLSATEFEPLQRAESGDAFVGELDPSAGPVAGQEVDFNNIPAENYFDLSARFAASDNLELVLTVQNLFDNKPTIVGSDIGSTAYNSGNIYPSTYDALGRRYAAAVKLRF
ncbi:TonB-dependent receptor [Qipengyuania sp. XHP0207]|nr:TonB-dependent receptor [Qipengyuania sp. XHP0207]MDG5749073.1 TonB-dependent receptor [Qipengyuania sp. XHP0207]